MENHENYNQGEFFDFNEFTLNMISAIFLKMTFFSAKNQKFIYRLENEIFEISRNSAYIWPIWIAWILFEYEMITDKATSS